MNVKIEKLVYGGEGLGHAEGHTVFVPFVLPGEVVAIRPVQRKKKLVRGALIQVAQPSPERIAPACPHFTACGGCHYQHIPCAIQLAYKVEILRETLWRLGRVQWAGDIHAHASPPFGYRNRAQWKIRATPEAARAASVVGYHRGGSSAVLPVEACPVLAPRLEKALQALRDLAACGQLPATLREVEAFADSPGDRLLLNASCTDFDGTGDSLQELFRSALGADSILLHHIGQDRFELSGPGFIHYRVAESAYRVGHLSFFQVNRFLLDELVAAVQGDARGAMALDLFAGVGLFAVPLAKRFSRVVAIESNEAAVRDLQANAEAAQAGIESRPQEVARYLASCKESPEFVVLDPPRAGLGAEAAAHLRDLRPGRIAYLSCDPATLARDLAALAAPGGAPALRIREIHLFDLFPQTYHIETLVHLERA